MLRRALSARPCTAALVLSMVSPALAEPAPPRPRPAESPSPEGEEPTLGEALRDGKLTVGLRYRFERVDDDALSAAAEASTLRASVAYGTLPYRGLRAHLEFSAVAEVGAEGHFNNAGAGPSGNGVTDRPVVADPELTRVNQVFASYERGATRLSAGRLELSLDDQRFVGPVKWRQSYQTFTAARLENRSLSRTVLSYAFLERAYTVTGGERPMASHLVNVAVELPAGTAVAYAYLLDFESEADAGLSTSTLGARFSGQRRAGRLTVGYEAAFAHQRERASNPSRVRAGYYRAGGSVGLPQLTLELGYEVLGGGEDDGRFTTPLATLHAFNGWADRFLATPVLGLRDLWAGLRGKAGPVAWRAVYHDFRPDEGGGIYGREVDLLAAYQAPWGQQWGAKAAFYRADEHSTDTTKLWVWSAYSF